MITLKDILCLLAILVAYGIVGRMDYEDAIALEQILEERDRLVANCTAIVPDGNVAEGRTSDGRLFPTSQSVPHELCFRPEP
jgi:hypothetical protein